jgi:nonsense-mediated mRNA decay protein 3
MKYTLTCDVLPLTRDDLIVIHKHTRGILAGRLGLVIKASSMVHIVDASPKRLAGMDLFELSAEAYHKAGGDRGYTILQTPERMVRFVVLDVELCENDTDDQLYRGPGSGVEKYAMADVLVARESDMGSNDLTYSCVTHLGHLIQPGDIVLGYDLESTAASLSASSSNGVVDVEDIVHSNVVLPDIVLVKKVAGKEVPEVEEETEDHDAGKKRMSKKKLRRQKKQDKRHRELEESAVRMGFLDDIEDDFEEALENDPELAAELDAMENQFVTLKDDIPAEETPVKNEKPVVHVDEGGSSL